MIVSSKKTGNKDIINEEAYTIQDKVVHNIKISYNHKDLNETEKLLKMKKCCIDFRCELLQ